MKQDFDLIKDCSNTILAISDTMEILNGKWKVSIIACLCYRPMRYSELLKEVVGISGKMLSRELKELEINGIVERKVYNQMPVLIEYELTESGRNITKVIDSMIEWGMAHRTLTVAHKPALID